MKAFALFFMATLFLLTGEQVWAQRRELNGLDCKAVVNLKWEYQPYTSEGNISSDFSSCPTQVEFNYGDENSNGKCEAIIGGMTFKIYFSFDILNRGADDNHSGPYKMASAGFGIFAPSFNGNTRRGEKGFIVEVDPQVNNFGFPFWITVPRMNSNMLDFQFKFHVNIEDQGCQTP